MNNQKENIRHYKKELARLQSYEDGAFWCMGEFRQNIERKIIRTEKILARLQDRYRRILEKELASIKKGIK